MQISNNLFNQLRSQYHASALQSKHKMVEKMSAELYGYLKYNTSFFLRPDQVVPDEWKGRYYLFQCGRGYGKTIAGAYWLANHVKNGFKNVAMVAPNFDDLATTMVPAFINNFPPHIRPKYIGGNQSRIQCANGAIVKCYTSEQEIRGGNFAKVWCDEIAKWCDSNDDKLKERFTTMDMTNRKGGSQLLITTTPKPFTIIREWNEMFDSNSPRIHIVKGTIDNNSFLDPSAVATFKEQYGNSRLGRQELNGELLLDMEGALWTTKLIESTRLTLEHYDAIKPYIIRTVIGVDPSGGTTTDSDMTGIVVVAMDDEWNCYILEDATNHYTPMGWAKKCNDLLVKYDADCIVAETNYGGAMVKSNIESYNPNLPIKLIHAKQAKIVRAAPAALRFELDKAHLVGNDFKSLERQMTTFTGDPRQKSPDSMDAMVYAMIELCLEKIYVNRDFRHVPQLG